MSEGRKVIKCPYCLKEINCKADSNDLIALRSHYNRSQECKQKRFRCEDSSNLPRGKNPRNVIDLAHIELLRDQVVIATEDIEAFNDDERFSCGNYWNDWDEESDMEDGHIKSSSFPYSGQGVENSMAVDMEVDSDLANKMAGIDVDDDEEEDVVSFEEFAGGEPIVLGTSPEACESTENAEKIASWLFC